MAKFYFEMNMKGPIEYHVNEIDEETYNELQDDEDAFECGLDLDIPLQEITGGMVLHMDNTDTFSLVVKDEDGNVVYETEDASEIPMFNYDGEKSYDYNSDEVDEDDDPIGHDLPKFKFTNVPDGFYIVEIAQSKWTTIEGDFEADEFDPSKLAFYPSEMLGYDLLEDGVSLSDFRYDGDKVEFGDVSSNDGNGDSFKLLKKDKYWSDNIW